MRKEGRVGTQGRRAAFQELFVGVDFGHRWTKVAVLGRTPAGGWGWVAAVEARTDPGLIVEGRLTDAVGAGRFLHRVLSGVRGVSLRGREAGILLSPMDVLTHRVRIEESADTDGIRARLSTDPLFVPVGPEGRPVPAQLAVARLPGEAGAGWMWVLGACASVEVVRGYQEVLASAGLGTGPVTVTAVALLNAWEVLAEEAEARMRVVLVHLGYRGAVILVLDAGEVREIYTPAVGGVESLIGEARLKLPHLGVEDVEAGLVLPGSRAVPGMVLEGWVQGIAQEVRRAAGSAGRQVGVPGGCAKVYLSGGGARTQGVDLLLRDELGIPVEVLDPFARIELHEQRGPPGFGPAWMAAFGLAAECAVLQEGVG